MLVPGGMACQRHADAPGRVDQPDVRAPGVSLLTQECNPAAIRRQCGIASAGGFSTEAAGLLPVAVFYDVTRSSVEVLAIVAKSEAREWLRKAGESV